MAARKPSGHRRSVRVEPLERRVVLDAAYQPIAAVAFTQDWGNTGLITADDDWGGVPGILGFRGDGLTASTNVDPQTVLGADSPGVLDVNANRTNPDTFTAGGVAEFDALGNPVVALQGSGTADAPYLLLHIDATGVANVRVQYLLRDVDGSADNSVQQVALHYRIGDSGDFVNVPAAYVADASATGAGAETTVDVVLPGAAGNQAQLQLRIMTTNAAGNDEWIGVDGIVVSSASAVLPGQVQFAVAATTVNEGDGTVRLEVLRVNGNSGAVSIDFTTNDGSAVAVDDFIAASGTLQWGDGDDAPREIVVTLVDDGTTESAETFTVSLSNPGGGATLGLPSQATVTIGDNDLPPAPAVVLNELLWNPPGTDNPFEYVELRGPASQALSFVYFVSVEGEGGGAGLADVVIDLGGATLGSNGLLMMRALSGGFFPNDPDTALFFEPGFDFGSLLENGSNSFLLVYSPVAIAPGTDLDPGNTGALNLPAGAVLLDAVGWRDTPTDLAYGADLTAPDGFELDAATRLAGDLDPLDVSAWAAGAIFGGLSGPASVAYDPARAVGAMPNNGAITPGDPNFALQSPNPGALDLAVTVAAVGEGDGTVTLTVRRLLGADGIVTVNFATANGDANAGSDYVAAAGTLEFAHGQTSADIIVTILDDGDVEQSETFLLEIREASGGAVVGPRALATVTIGDNDAAAPDVVLNEVNVNPPGTDNPFEFIEIRGTPGATLGGVYVVSVEGDGSGAGLADRVYDLSAASLGANGLLIIKSPTGGFFADPDTTVITDASLDNGGGGLENGSNSFLILFSTSPILAGVDLDTNNDGVLDLPAGAVVLDGAGASDGDAGDRVYGADLTQATFTPDAFARYLDRLDPLDPAAWYGGDLDSADPAANATINFDPLRVLANLPTGATLTPGAANFAFPGDVIPPEVTATALGFETAPLRHAITFSEDVSGSLTLADLVLERLGAGVIDSASLSLAYDAGTNVATLTFPGLPGGLLANGNYRLTVLAAGVNDAAGNPLASDATSAFFWLNGDANRDRAVDVTDLGILASNWQASGRLFSDADFNLDGTVDVSDLGILASNWQEQVLPPASPSLGGRPASLVEHKATRAPLFGRKRVSAEVF